MIVYGIKNCDTVRKARKFLDERAADYEFHDFRQDGLDERTVNRWAEIVGTDQLVNRRSRTWRELPSKAKADTSEAAMVKLMVSEPTLIKRPVIEIDGLVLVGFDETALTKAL